jgi:hypothetical protein
MHLQFNAGFTFDDAAAVADALIARQLRTWIAFSEDEGDDDY